LYWVNLATYQDTSPYLSLAIFVTHYTLIPSNPEEPKINHVGLKDTNTYLFIKGHIVYDNVVLRLLPLVCKRLQTERKNEIKKLARNNTELNDELNKYNNSLVQVEKILSVNNNFKNCFLFKKIEDDINNYISLYMDN
jgi:hypothetical protein